MSRVDPRRERAAILFADGATQAEVARELAVSRVTAMQWHREWEQGVLLVRRRRGRRPRLRPDQESMIRGALQGSPRDHGIPVERWSLAAVASLVEKLTAVSYHPRHVPRLLQRWGWIVPPVGRHAEEARLFRACTDPDGNGLLLIERRGLDPRLRSVHE